MDVSIRPIFYGMKRRLKSTSDRLAYLKKVERNESPRLERMTEMHNEIDEFGVTIAQEYRTIWHDRIEYARGARISIGQPKRSVGKYETHLALHFRRFMIGKLDLLRLGPVLDLRKISWWRFELRFFSKVLWTRRKKAGIGAENIQTVECHG